VSPREISAQQEILILIVLRGGGMWTGGTWVERGEKARTRNLFAGNGVPGLSGEFSEPE